MSKRLEERAGPNPVYVGEATAFPLDLCADAGRNTILNDASNQMDESKKYRIREIRRGAFVVQRRSFLIWRTVEDPRSIGNKTLKSRTFKEAAGHLRYILSAEEFVFKAPPLAPFTPRAD
jgi:hypothetical protein